MHTQKLNCISAAVYISDTAGFERAGIFYRFALRR